jgi:hypothetical protein
VLESLSSTDPHLKKLIEEIASGQISTAKLQELQVYIDKSKSIILAQEIESRRGSRDHVSSKPKQLPEDRPGSFLVEVEANAKKVEDLEVTEDRKDLEGLKAVPCEKIEEGQKPASNSIETTQKKDPKKE